MSRWISLPSLTVLWHSLFVLGAVAVISPIALQSTFYHYLTWESATRFVASLFVSISLLDAVTRKALDALDVQWRNNSDLPISYWLSDDKSRPLAWRLWQLKYLVLHSVPQCQRYRRKLSLPQSVTGTIVWNSLQARCHGGPGGRGAIVLKMCALLLLPPPQKKI